MLTDASAHYMYDNIEPKYQFKPEKEESEIKCCKILNTNCLKWKKALKILSCLEVINMFIVFATLVGGLVLFWHEEEPKHHKITNPIFKDIPGEYFWNEDYGMHEFMIMYGTSNSIMCYYAIHKFIIYLRKGKGPIPDGSHLRKQVVYGYTFLVSRIFINTLTWAIWYKYIEELNIRAEKFNIITDAAIG